MDRYCECGRRIAEKTGRTCTFCDREVCDMCAMEPTEGIEENWHDTGWDVCRGGHKNDPETCHYKAIDALKEELDAAKYGMVNPNK